MSDETLSYSEAKDLLDALLARSARDAVFRQLCLVDGREAVQVSMGLDLPEGVTVHFVEHQGQGAGIILPPFDGEAIPVVAVDPPAEPPAPTPEVGDGESKPAPRGLNIRPKQG